MADTQLVEEKPWYLSKTMWLNIGAVVLAILTTLLDITGVIDLGPHKAQIVAAITSAIAVVNIVLRSITKSPLTMK